MERASTTLTITTRRLSAMRLVMKRMLQATKLNTIIAMIFMPIERSIKNGVISIEESLKMTLLRQA